MEESRAVGGKDPKGEAAVARETTKEIADRLNRVEAQKFGGAPERLPKSRLLDARAIEAKDPEHHYRYVNVDESAKVQARLDEGYERVSEKECRDSGVRQQVGEGVLMRIPRGKYEERVERQREIGKRRLGAHRAEVQKVAEAVIRQLRDQHGINIPLSRLLVDE